jgi:photosynthetic reaction center cytochrome c subunit
VSGRGSRGRMAACWVIAVAALHANAAAQAPRTPPPLQNVKLLAGWTADEVRGEMRRMAEAVGVKCDHCHVQGNFASDEKRPKRAGRRMLELTLALNRDYFPAHVPAEGESKLGRITCYTCHQGSATPRTANAGGLVVR